MKKRFNYGIIGYFSIIALIVFAILNLDPVNKWEAYLKEEKVKREIEEKYPDLKEENNKSSHTGKIYSPKTEENNSSSKDSSSKAEKNKSDIKSSPKPYTGSSSSKSKNDKYQSYDDGYEDIIEEGEYDIKRYDSDSDYASGVDDAREDFEEETGEEW